MPWQPSWASRDVGTPSPTSPRPLRGALAGVLAVLCLVLGGMPAVGQSAGDSDLQRRIEALDSQRSDLRLELQRAQQERDAAARTLQQATERVEALEAELGRVRSEVAELEARVEGLEAQAAAVRDSLATRLRALYRGDRPDDLLGILTGLSPVDVGRRSHYLSALSRHDGLQLEQAAATRRTLARARTELETARTRTGVLLADAAAARSVLDARLAEAAEVEQGVQTAIARADAQASGLRAEVARREEAARAAAARQAAERAAASARRAPAAASRTAPRPAPVPAARPPAAPPRQAPVDSQGKACPQDQPRSFTDTWGAPRSGGRRHQGTDIFGARGGAVFAITDGVVKWTRTGGISGLFLSLAGDDGNEYWYIHLQDFVARAGQRVRSGELIAHNGDTGNARGKTPHIHFELHPGGGGAVNPYPLLRQVCG